MAAAAIVAMAVGEYVGLSPELIMAAKSLLGIGLGWMGYGLRVAKEPVA